MIDSQLGAVCLVGYNHFISNKREWNNFFITNNQEILLDFPDFVLQEQLEDNLMVSMKRPVFYPVFFLNKPDWFPYLFLRLCKLFCFRKKTSPVSSLPGYETTL